jgi:hypothetical protein
LVVLVEMTALDFLQLGVELVVLVEVEVVHLLQILLAFRAVSWEAFLGLQEAQTRVHRHSSEKAS